MTPDIFAGKPAQHQAGQRPVDHADAAYIARTQNQVRLLDRFQKRGNIVRVVREIAVHLEDEFVFFLQRPFEAGDVSAAQAVFLLLVQDVNLRVFCGEFVRDFSRAIR